MEVPAFERSGQGDYKDLKGILIAQMLGWGNFRQQFTTQYKGVTSTRWFNGRRVYNKIPLKGRLDSGSKTYDFMKFIGFTEEDITRLNNQINDKNAKIEEAWLRFTLSMDFERDDFEMALETFRRLSYKFDKLRITVVNDMYGRSIRNFGIKYSTPLKVYDKNANPLDHDDMITFELPILYIWKNCGDNPLSAEQCIVGITPNKDLLYENVRFSMIKNGQKVGGLSITILRWLMYLAILEQGMITERLHSTRKFEKVVYTKGKVIVDYPTKEKHVVTMTERTYEYDFTNIDFEALKKRFSSYVYKRSGSTIYDVTKTVTRLFWIARNDYLQNDLESITEGMFYTAPSAFDSTLYALGTTSWRKEVFLRVDGIEKASSDTFAYYLSAFMDIEYKQKKQSFIKRFIGGLIRFITRLVGAVLRLFMKIPVLKQIITVVIKLIASLAGVSFDVAQDILAAIILAVATMFIGGMMSPASSMVGISTGAATGTATGMLPGLTSGMMGSVTYLSRGISLLNAISSAKTRGEIKELQEQEMEEQERKDKLRRDKLAEEKQKPFMGTLGTLQQHESIDDIMYNRMFNPFFYHPQAVPAPTMDAGYLFQ